MQLHKPLFLLIAVFSVFLTKQLTAQQYEYYEHISSEFVKLYPGLSQNDVNCILQDKTGNLWIGTWDGLNRYDGYDYNILRPNLETPEKSINHRSINALFEDKSGILWIGTDKGLNAFNRRAYTFKHYKANQLIKNSLGNDSINSITQDKMGNLWVGTRGGCYQIKTNGEITHLPIEEKNSCHYYSNSINFIFCDHNGWLWIGTACGLKVYNPDLKKFIVPEMIKGFLLSEKLNFSAILQESDNIFWFGSNQGIFKTDLKNGNIVHFHEKAAKETKINNNVIFCLSKDINGNIWAGTDGNGIIVIEFISNRIITAEYSFLKNLSNYYVKSIYTDRNGIIWIGTIWQGLIKYDKNAYRFRHFAYQENEKKGINSPLVWSVFEDPATNKIWIGTNNGINIYSPENESFEYISHSQQNKNSLSGNLIRDIIKDRDGIFWICTKGDGLNSYNPVTKIFKHFQHNPADPHSISSDFVWKAFEDSKGNLWIGTDYGLNILDRKTNRFIRYFHQKDNKNSINNNTVFSIYEDSKGKIWFSTYNGLNLYHPQTNSFTALTHIEGKNSMSVNSVFSVYEDKNNILWIGTLGGGLNRYDPRTGVFKIYSEKNGLANNIVYRILEDIYGHLWLSTNHGISRFDPSTETFVNYGVNDGIQSYEFNHNAALKASDGYFYFGGMNGFNRFKPDNIRINKNIPPVVISSFRIFHVDQKKEFRNGDTIYLSYYENFFSFEFSALDFSNPVKNQFKYRLKNFKNHWTITSSDYRLAEFTKVPAGTYFFEVKASNNDGIWNEKGIKICVIIKPAWWQTWWFISLNALIAIALLFFAFIFYNFRIRTKHELEKKMLSLEKDFIEAQQKALRYQMNPHFIFNSMNSIQNFILQKKEEEAHLYLTNFSSLMRKTLENSKYSLISLQEEIDTLELYLQLEGLRFSNQFTFVIKTADKLNTLNISIPPMLIQPYLENAIWHGLVPKKGNGLITIEFKLHHKNTLLVCITDNGIGRQKAAEIGEKRKHHKPTGMRNIEERLELMNRLNKTNMRVKVIDFKDKNNEATGTCVEIYIQFQQN